MGNVYARMKAVLASLDFDFNNFTMDRFTAWVQERHGREIRFVPWKMPPGLFGVWMSDADEPVEHVFVDSNVPPLQAVHIQLHELGHILCKHPTARLTQGEMVNLLQRGLKDPAALNELLLRAPMKAEWEEEAETLAALIQDQAIRHERLQQLEVAASSDESVAAYLKAMELA